MCHLLNNTVNLTKGLITEESPTIVKMYSFISIGHAVVMADKVYVQY